MLTLYGHVVQRGDLLGPGLQQEGLQPGPLGPDDKYVLALDVHVLGEVSEYVVHVVLAVAADELPVPEGLDVAVDEGHVPFQPVGLAFSVVVVFVPAIFGDKFKFIKKRP